MIEGRNLWNAVDLVERAGKEIVAMQAELSKKMAERLEKVGRESNFKFDAGNEDGLFKDDWVCIAWLSQWWIKKKNNKTKYNGNLSIQIVLWSEEGDRDPCGKIPRVEVVYIGFDDQSQPNSDYGAGTWFFSPDEWGDYCVTADGKCVISTKPDKTLDGSKWDVESEWYFAIPLFSVNCNDDIEHFIIEPAMKLLNGTAPEVALKGVPAISFSIDTNGVLFSKELSKPT